VHGTNKSESLSGNGIHVWNGEQMTIENNTLSGNRDGIYFEFVKNSSIRKNKSIKNLRYGLHFMYSHYNEYRENIFSDNECGVAVMYSRGVQMFRNRFEHSHGSSSYGILLKDISDSVVVGNKFLDNTIGIFIDGTTRTNFEGNLFKNNGWALRVLGDTDSNKFTRNDFILNTFDVATNATSNQNEFSENYWNRYKGLDLNNDGFGDEAYHLVHLSSMLISNYQASILLIHSLFFTILDQIESALPVLIPKTYNDIHPSMERVTDL
jgi:nitrous oxidase accessory protein